MNNLENACTECIRGLTFQHKVLLYPVFSVNVISQPKTNMRICIYPQSTQNSTPNVQEEYYSKYKSKQDSSPQKNLLSPLYSTWNSIPNENHKGSQNDFYFYFYRKGY